MNKPSLLTYFFTVFEEVMSMGEIERKIITEIEQNEDFKQYMNEQMREMAQRLAQIQYFSESFRKFMERVARGEIKIW